MGCALTAGCFVASSNNLRNAPTITKVNNQTSLGCDSKLSEIGRAVDTFTSGGYLQIQEARDSLLRNASESAACRTAVIRTLMDRMDQPGLDLESDTPSYLIWREGATLLGELKASEALDLLISHLHLNDGYHSSSQVHQPAIPGVLALGDIAIPKLEIALRENANPRLRLAAAYCLTSIGGRAAMKALAEARKTESDGCVSRFINVSLGTFVHKSKAGQMLFDTAAPKADIQKRTQWLAAFECTE